MMCEKWLTLAQVSERYTLPEKEALLLVRDRKIEARVKEGVLMLNEQDVARIAFIRKNDKLY